MVIRRIGVLSLATVMGALYGLLGLIFGGIFALFSLLGAGLLSTMQTEDAPSALFSVMFGVGAVIFLPILYGLMGFVGGALGAWLYNVVAAMTGGLRLEVEQTHL